TIPGIQIHRYANSALHVKFVVFSPLLSEPPLACIGPTTPTRSRTGLEACPRMPRDLAGESLAALPGLLLSEPPARALARDACQAHNPVGRGRGSGHLSRC